jgi:hypothetical protein
VEFSRFNPRSWRGSGLYLARFGRDPRVHPGRLGRNAWLNLSRLGLGARVELPRFYRYARLHLSGSGMSPRLGLARTRPGRCCRGKPLGFARYKLLLGRQLLNLLGHLRGQVHGGPGGQRRARQTPSRLQRRGLDPGNSSGDARDIFGRRYEIGPVQVNPGHFGIWRQPGWRQTASLGQGRRDNLSDVTMPVDHPPGRHHTVDPGDVGGVAGDNPVNLHPVVMGDPGEVHRRGAHVIVAGAESPTAEKSRRVIRRGGVSRIIHGLGIEHRHIGRGHQIPGVHIRIGRRIRLPETQQKLSRLDKNPQGRT